MRKFEKISYEQFKRDIIDDRQLYEEYEIPSRETYYAAGYDFHALCDFVIKPGMTKKIPTGIKAEMENDEVLLIVVRSSQGFNYNVRLIHQVGVVDKDYYNNPTNEGHIWIGLKNEGIKDYVVNKGDGIAQGMFIKYLLTANDDINEKTLRNDDDKYLKKVR